jgi:hypothetical protein
MVILAQKAAFGAKLVAAELLDVIQPESGISALPHI